MSTYEVIDQVGDITIPNKFGIAGSWEQINAVKCECGAEKSNTTHFNWCPKWS